MVGGGSLPGSTLSTKLVAVGKSGQRNVIQTLARGLRRYDPPVIGRISEDVLLLDPRTVLPEQDEIVLQALNQAVASLK